jgi:thioesterase domain-containing protein
MARIYVEAVKRIQPDGPYFLLGYSMGGSVAYEMACQLHARGNTIAHLVLVDSGRPDGTIVGVQRVARKMSRQLAVLSDIKPSRWAGHILGEIRREITKVRHRHQPQPQLGLATAPVPRRLEKLINQTLMTAFVSYVPQRFAGAIKLFRCMYGIGSRWSLRHYGWEGRAMGGVEVIDLPASHYEALSEPAVALVAAYIKRWLAEAGT